ncbi:hypothetical protein ACFL6I_04225 [candidate division KSB1 bacterium]
MAYPKVKGSIILKILVVIAAIILLLSIFIPNRIWTQEIAEEDECHFRMLALVEVQYQFREVNNSAIADSLEQLINLVHTDSTFKARCDSVLQILHETETAAAIKESRPFRLYQDIPVVVDSVFHCPSTGLPYNIVLGEDEGFYLIVCPQDEDEFVKQYRFFEKRITHHGSADQGRERSWN